MQHQCAVAATGVQVVSSTRPARSRAARWRCCGRSASSTSRRCGPSCRSRASGLTRPTPGRAASQGDAVLESSYG